ncbi:MAG TPA: alpha-2-macroglobulin family protein, partial [Chitinophagaceae bacterium]|nr:alpha-2-macroglobulin family protein [Chitinophagaceae bacterium]
EYTRPRFYVDYEPVRAEVRIYDSVHVTGTARAYAGQAVDQARVRYRVVRQPRFIYPWLLSRGWYPKGGPQELAHGETTTDATGHFEIRFRALPDLSIDSKLDPLFDYRVYADVTDVNGETRSGETTVQAGYHRLVVKLNLAGSLPCDSFRSVPVRTETVNGQFQPSRIHLVITRLKTENRLIRPRYWERPDQFVMTRQDYLSWFPHDEYDGESDMNTWAADSVVLDRYDSLSHESGLTLDRTLVRNRPFAAGYYRVEVTTLDRDSSLIANRQFLELYDPRTSALTRPAYLWSQDAAATEPGRTVALRVGTAASDCYIIQEIQRPHDSSASLSYLPFDHQVRDIPFSPTEQDRGGIPVRYFMVRDNRFFQVAGLVPVPWTNKELQLEVGTFRDKMLPGSQETWNLTIRGPKKEWVAAEMLASMYDASLDQFKFHAWTLPPVWETSSSSPAWEGTRCFSPSESLGNPFGGTTEKILQKQYDELILHMQRENPLIAIYGYRSMENALEGRVAGISVVTVKKELAGAVTKFTSQDSTQSAGAGQQDTGQPAPIQIRRDFKETAFFFPDLHTDSSGNIRFSFTMPEATTRWKFQALAHTRDLALGYTNLSVVTQKQLMVQPNAPRFLREGDRIEFSAKIVNLTDKELTGQAELQLFDAATNQPVDGWFQNMYAHQYFTVAAGQSEPVQFAIEVPYLFNKALTWRILARAGDFSDGEEASIPVLTSKVLVTESLPLSMMGSGTKKYTFTNLLHSGESESLQHFALTVEYSANPAWYALQALPYLIEFPQECAEQTWNRYYANALGTSLLSRMPRLREILDRWKGIDSTELLSNLQKNEELKSVLLQETPWVLQARDEAQQKKNLALLMDLNRMQPELGRNLERLRQLQTPNGGFTWFAGGPDDRYITQYIVSGMGHLRKLQAVTASQWQQIITLLKPALTYLDQRLAEDYAQRQKRPGVRQGPPALLQVQYLYARSFFPDIPISAPARKALDYFYSLARTSWVTQNKFLQGMIALAAFRKGDTQTAAAILQSLRQTAIRSEDLGMYWKAGSAGWYWYEAPIERQALLIEAFQEAGKDPVTADLLRHWLLSNKQTNQWSSTRATADACYSLLLSGSDWLPRSPAVEVQLGPAVVSSDTGQPDAGSSYFKKTIQGQFISPEMGQITLRVREAEPQTDTAVSPRKLPAAGPSWGAVYWQYFEDMDRVKAAVSPLQVKKSLYIVRNSDRGPVLTPLEEGETLHLGDKVTVRIELRADRDMEYVQMKDFRASSLEPIHVLSGYQWQGGLGYYEATRDASTNFFFDRLPRGSYVFEYTLFATQKGNFSNGITTVQCMYAPEFGAHSSGIRIQVE